MLAKTCSFGLSGLDAITITIEADTGKGLPCMTVVGLPDNAVKESRERVRTALRNCGFAWPQGRITVNLAPADTRKEGPAFDLAIALAILAASEQILLQHTEHFAFMGELSLSGSIKPVSGIVCAAMAAGHAAGLKGLIVPISNRDEAAMVCRLPVWGFQSLNEVAAFLNNPTLHPPHQAEEIQPGETELQEDLAEVKGQARAKRALEVAAAGSHNILLIGPPGSGKTMLAKRLPGILPSLSRQESLEVTRILSASGLLRPGAGLQTVRPFRSPHHSASHIALIGGGSDPRPGEITLAHHGVLFMDELPEYTRPALEALRQPLEDGQVTVSRAARAVRFPARFMLVAAMNPCPCGRFGDRRKSCRCNAEQIRKYLHRISGPLMERIDIHLELPGLDTAELMELPPGETSSEIRQRVARARLIQKERLEMPPTKDNNERPCNSQMPPRQIRRYCTLDRDCRNLMKEAVDSLGLSARAHDKVLKVARTVSDLAGCEDIKAEHLAEAIGYRCLDKTNF